MNELAETIKRYECIPELETHVDGIWNDWAGAAIGGVAGLATGAALSSTLLRDSSAGVKIGATLLSGLFGAVVGESLTPSREETNEEKLNRLLELTVERTRALELGKSMKLFGLRVDAPQLVFYLVMSEKLKALKETLDEEKSMRWLSKLVALQVAAKDQIIPSYHEGILPVKSEVLLQESQAVLNWRPALEG